MRRCVWAACGRIVVVVRPSHCNFTSSGSVAPLQCRRLCWRHGPEDKAVACLLEVSSQNVFYLMTNSPKAPTCRTHRIIEHRQTISNLSKTSSLSLYTNFLANSYYSFIITVACKSQSHATPIFCVPTSPHIYKGTHHLHEYPESHLRKPLWNSLKMAARQIHENVGSYIKTRRVEWHFLNLLNFSLPNIFLQLNKYAARNSTYHHGPW